MEESAQWASTSCEIFSICLFYFPHGRTVPATATMMTSVRNERGLHTAQLSSCSMPTGLRYVRTAFSHSLETWRGARMGFPLIEKKKKKNSLSLKHSLLHAPQMGTSSGSSNLAAARCALIT